MNAMILAAGRGERLRPITDDTPKALVEIAGESLLEHHLRRVAAAGIRNVVVNLDWLGEQIVERIADGDRFGLHVCYSPEFGAVLETAGGIKRALPLLGPNPFWVLNADVFTDISLPVIRLPKNQMAHLVLVPTPAFKAIGDFDLIDGLVRNASEPRWTYSGIGLYRPEFFADLPPTRAALGPLLRKAADDGALGGELYDGVWEDIGTPERLTRARQRT